MIIATRPNTRGCTATSSASGPASSSQRAGVWASWGRPITNATDSPTAAPTTRKNSYAMLASEIRRGTSSRSHSATRLSTIRSCVGT